MSTRLQVVMDEAELREIRRAARRDRLTVSEWVRRCLREARRRQPLRDADRKVQAIRAAARHTFPTADVERMLTEIESGYLRPPVGS
jgi:predicted 2-oxoglutarate/Fe(II)-dependent dioxygenase YbiX